MTFIATMFAGFAAATLGTQMPLVEVVIGRRSSFWDCWSRVKAPVWLGATVAGLFAFFQGHAHGTEATAASLVPYAVGFALTTAGLHLAGIGLGLFAERSIGKGALRAMGGLAVLGALTLIRS
jgi:urease accessory protein